MSAADIQAAAFTDETAAREAIERLMWPNGPYCPHCGSLDKIGKIEGKSARPGLYYCGSCKKQFTVTVGTIFERSKVPLSKWLLAIHLLASSKKGMSSNQFSRMLGVTVQTAWFMSHRIREAMRDGNLSPMGGGGSIVEIDETYIGRKEGFEVKQGAWHKNSVLTLVERGGAARSFHVDGATKETIVPKLDIALRDLHKMIDLVERNQGRFYDMSSNMVPDYYEEYTANDFLDLIKEIIKLNGDVEQYWQKILVFSLTHERARRERPPSR